jgi:ATP-dependent RNA helicase DDX49/DBP8
MDMVHQTSALAQRPHFVVATPGRLADILADPLNNVMKRIKFLVLDEADRLLDPSFEPALAVIFSCIPPSRSTFLFSATITDAITQLRALSNVCQFIFRASVLAATSGHHVMSPRSLFCLHVAAFEFDTASDSKTVEGLTQKFVFSAQTAV